MSLGKIGKGDLFDSTGIKSDVDEILNQLKRIPIELSKISEQVKSASGFKELIGLSKQAESVNEKYIASLNKLQASIDNLTKTMSTSRQETLKNNKSISEGTRLKQQTIKEIIKTRLAQKGLTRELITQQIKRQELNKTTREQIRSELGLSKSSSGLRTAFKTLTAQLRNLAVAYLGVQTIIRGFQDIFQVTKTLDAIFFSQQRVIKTQNEFAQTQQFLSRIISDYGLDLVAVTERYTKFRAATNSSNLTAIQTQEIFESVSKASAVLGLRTDELRGVYLALEQMISKGTVTTEELRRQLGERLPGAFQIMATALGTTTEGLNKMLRNGEVLAEEALPKFINALEEAYGIKSVKQVDTLTASQNRLRTSWIEFIKLIDGTDFFKDVLNGLSLTLKWIGDNIVIISNLFKSVVNLGIVFLGFRSILKITNNAAITYLATTRGITVAQAALTFATIRAKNAINALKVAFSSTGIGTLIIGISSLVALLLPFLKTTKDTSDEVKGLNEEISESDKKLRVLFSSLKNAGKGTEEWKAAKQEINKEFGQYLDNIITENTTLDEINKAYEKLISVSRSLAAERKKKEDTDKALNELFEVENNQIETLRKNLNELVLNQELTREEAILQEKAYLDFAKSLAKSGEDVSYLDFQLQNLIYAYRRFDKTISDINKTYNLYIKALEKDVPFDQEKFIKELEIAKKEFEEFSLLRSSETKKYFKENSQFINDDTKTYRKYLLDLLKLHADNIAARIIIEKELSSLSTSDSAVSIQKERNKRLLEEERSRLEKELKLNIEILSEKGAIREEIDALIEDQDRSNKIKLLNLELEQNKKLLNISKDDAKEQEKIRADIAKIYADIDKEQTDQSIVQAERLNEKKMSIAEQELENQRQITNENIVLIEKNNQIAIDKVAEMYRNREISAEEYAKRVEAIEAGLQKKILKEQLKSLKKQLEIQNLRPEEAYRIKGLISKLESDIATDSVNTSKSSSELIIENRRMVKEKSREFINELFNVQQAFSNAQLERAEYERDFQVALAGSNIEAKIKAERKFEKEELKIRQRQAIAQKAQSVFNIITNTADGITKALALGNLFLIGLITAIGAAQLAVVLAQPIPKFAEGVKDHKGGLAIVGDKKGDKTLTKKGGTELITLPTGKSFLSENFPTLMNLPKGTSVMPHDETQKLLAVRAKQSAYDLIDMSKSEKYLEEISNKEDINYVKGYKIVTRKNFKGVYANTRI